MKKLIAFDLDGTLAESKSKIPHEISILLDRLLNNFQICVISGGKFEQFEKQLLAGLHISKQKLQNLHLMPTCGTMYYLYDLKANHWNKIYSEDLSLEQKKKIIDAIEISVKKLKYQEKKVWGDVIEDRGSQITFSALGQEAPVEAKEEWDPEAIKKNLLRRCIIEIIPEFEVRAGGSTSIDITRLGIDKAYGMKKLMKKLNLKKEDVLFFGDKLEKGGNDYPVKEVGIKSIEVSHWKDTAKILDAINIVIE